MSYALDRNLLIRLLTLDDETQDAKVVRLHKTQGSRRTGAPDAWRATRGGVGLRSRYSLAREQIRTAFGAMLETTAIVVESPATLEGGLMLFGRDPSADFVDCMHVAGARQHGAILATFDRGAARLPAQSS